MPPPYPVVPAELEVKEQLRRTMVEPVVASPPPVPFPLVNNSPVRDKVPETPLTVMTVLKFAPSRVHWVTTSTHWMVMARVMQMEVVVVPAQVPVKVEPVER